jgi:hypothetical protein
MRDDDQDGLPKPGGDISTDSRPQAETAAAFAPDPNISQCSLRCRQIMRFNPCQIMRNGNLRGRASLRLLVPPKTVV